MAELRKAVCQRKTVRTRVTSCHNRLKGFELLTSGERAMEVANLEEYQKSLKELDDCIYKLKYSSEGIDETEIQTEMDTCADYSSKILDCLALLEKLTLSDAHSTLNSNFRHNTDVARSLLRQPVAPLPTFSGAEGEDLMKFLKEFELTTNNYNYPERDLLLLLVQQVSGRARTLIKSLEADKQSYGEAKKLLSNAFASPEILKFSSIKRLTELRLDYDDDPFEFISKVKMLAESVNSLNIQSEDFLQYFAWQGLNQDFKLQLVQITTKNRPSFKEIMDNFFSANEWYANDKKFKSVKQLHKDNEHSTSSLAADVNPKGKFSGQKCNLCVDGNNTDYHPIFRCSHYQTSADKLERIKNLKGCVKCASLGHDVNQCKFRFKRKCVHCRKWHFDFLCPTFSNSNASKKRGEGNSVVKTETNSGVVVLPCLSNDAVLPTFSFTIGENGKMLRGLKDTGSQSSFIAEKVVKELELQVIKEDVKLVVNGFNGPQNYSSKIVRFPIAFNAKTYDIQAMMVPEIKIDLQLPNLGNIVKNFISKGYHLADEFLTKDSNSISDIDFLLGADMSHCLLSKDVCFGASSVFFESADGILLTGKISKLELDLPYLPYHVTASTGVLSTGDTSMEENTKCESNVFFRHILS